MHTTLNIPEPIFVSAPNGGGLLYAHRHLLMPLLNEDATGLSVTADGLLWCMQADGSRSLREIRQGQLLTTPLAQTPLDLHDVLLGADGIYAVFTETNQVVCLDDAFRIQERWSFGEKPDSVHVNCIVWHNGRLLASMFGDFAEHRGYKGKSRKAGRVVDVRSGELLIEGLSQPHSLVSVGDRLWLCSSEDCALQVYDQHFSLERNILLPGYARGLAVGEHGVYVGISRSRNLSSEEVSSFSSAVISVLDRRSLDVVGHVPIPWNEIYDIRLVPAHFPVPGVMASLWGLERKQEQVVKLELQREIAKVKHEADEVHAAWQTEKEARIAAEKLAEAQSGAAQEAMVAWKAEREIRMAAEQQAQVQGEARTIAEQALETARIKQAELQGEIVKRNAQITLLEQIRAELQQIKASRSWRWTRPLRFMLRTMRHRGLSPEDRRRLGWPQQPEADVASSGMLASALEAVAVSHALPPAERCDTAIPGVLLAPQGLQRRDFFLWAVIDWHFRIQRPQHLARELAAAGHRVFYISNNFIDRAEPGFSIEALDDEGRLFQVHLHLIGSPAIYHAVPDVDQREQLRAGIGLQSTPANLILISLSLFMTFYVMAPTFDQAWNTGIRPLMDNQINQTEALEKISDPFRGFMLRNVRDKDFDLFADLARERGQTVARENVDLRILVPAFMISEIRRGFEIGFLIVLPFLVIDLVVATITMSMGMMMLPPTVLSLPFKIMFFVLIDGWNLLVGSLVRSFS